MKRLGAHQGLAPVLDVVRDLRWGRTEETIGEDPYLVGTIGSAYVRGLESAGVVATLKHFVGYSASRARQPGPCLDRGAELCGRVPAALRDGAALGCPVGHELLCNLDGVPVASDGALFTELLRGKYGFQGTVVSDYFAVAFLQKLHGVAGSPSEAAQLALSAGSMSSSRWSNRHGQPSLDAVASGQVGTVLVDRALERVLRQKCELGSSTPIGRRSPRLLAEGDGDGVLDDEAIESSSPGRSPSGRSLSCPTTGYCPSARCPGGSGRATGGRRRGHARRLLVPDACRPALSRRPHGRGRPYSTPSPRSGPGRLIELSFAQGCSVTEGTDEEIAEAAGVAADRRRLRGCARRPRQPVRRRHVGRGLRCHRPQAPGKTGRAPGSLAGHGHACRPRLAGRPAVRSLRLRRPVGCGRMRLLSRRGGGHGYR